MQTIPMGSPEEQRAVIERIAADPNTYVEETRRRQAQVAHQRCLDRWAELGRDGRRMATFHGLDAHLT